MAGVQDQLEIKFRLTDGSDIGPKSFPAATSVVNLKESILAQWPKEKDNGPRTVKDVKLISAGRILENNRTVAECRSPLCDVPGGVTTMHVVVQPPSQEKETDERAKAEQMRLCYIITFAAQIVGITSFLGERELELIKENEMDKLADRFSSIGIMQASCHMSYALVQVRRTLFAVKSVGLCYITHSCLIFLCKEFLCCICIHVLQSNLFHSPCIIFNRTILEIILCQGIGKALDGVATVLRYALRCVVQQNAMPPQLGP